MSDDCSSVPSATKISDIRLPETARELVQLYDRRIGQRPAFLWRWLYTVLPRCRLSSVPDRFHESVREQKLVLTIYYTLLDDLADTFEDRETFTEVRKLPRPGVGITDNRPDVDTDYVAFTETVWETVEAGIRDAPRSDQFWEIFEFDCHQVINAMDYGLLVNEHPALVTEPGTDRYNEHNMALFSYADIDIMYSPEFETSDLRPLRRVIWRAQRLARIANWVATWEREVETGDLTSAVAVRALTEDVLSHEELTDPEIADGTLISRIQQHGIEQSFIDEWDRLYTHLRDQQYAVESLDMHDYIRGMEEIRDLYLANRGRI